MMQNNLLETQGVLSVNELQTVSGCVEKYLDCGTCLGQLELLLNQVSDTFSYLLESESIGNRDWGQLTVKICLQIFQAVPKSIRHAVWNGQPGKEALQRIVGFLFQVIVGQNSHIDSRLLASTALVKLINNTPQPYLGAMAAIHALQLIQQEVQDLTLGELEITLPVMLTDGLGSLLMCRGLISCIENEVLVCQLPDFQNGTCILLEKLFPIILTHCGDKRNLIQSRAFEVLSLWLKSTKVNIAEIWKLRDGRLLDQHSSFTTQVLELLWDKIESPVASVLESVHCCFSLFLDVYRVECSHFGDVELPLYTSQLQHIKALSWQVKAKYLLLSSLVSCFGAKKVLDDYDELPKHLLNCLMTKHLCSPASHLYKTILQQHRLECTLTQVSLSEQELAESWAQLWLEILTEALSFDLPVFQQNTANYFLVQTLQVFPASFHILSRVLNGHHLGWITLLNAQQINYGSLPMDSDTLRKLRASLHCQDDHVRLLALSLLCISPKTSQALSPKNLSLLKEFLPLNLNCNSSSFRHLLQANVKKALVRIRDSCLLHFRSQRRLQSNRKTGESVGVPPALLSEGVAFVQWLLELCVTSLLPSLNYQRKKTALLLMEALLETCTDSWSPMKKKGQPPQDMTELLNFARQRGCWEFLSESNQQMLLVCLLDETNEIRELAAKLLLTYLPARLSRSLSTGLFECAFSMLTSPRIFQAEAGALMLKTALQKSDVLVLQGIAEQGEAPIDVSSQPLNFVTYLHQLLEQQYRVAQEDLLQAAATKPMHGLIMALRKCLTEVPETLASLWQETLVRRWKQFISQLLDTLSNISHFLFDSLSGTHRFCSSEQDTAPSLADMGIAIKAVIAARKGLEQDVGEDLVLLTEDDRLILSCCWVTLRELGLLLGYLVELVLPPHSSGDTIHLLSVTQIQDIARIFLNILLKCRHWGVVEGCSAAFTKFCASLLKQQAPELKAIPRQILEQGLSGLQGPRSSSITRRAAGLPILLLCVMAGEESKSQPLLHYCMKTLLDIANVPLSSDWDQTIDLPQVCSIHTLQTLTRSSVLGSAVLTYTSNMAALCLRGLSSASWAMRNAAIQLFSALACRVLGQKTNDGDSVKSEMTSVTFFMQYPELKSLFLQELQFATSQDSATEEGQFHLYPSLHPILTLLAKLQPSVDDTHGDCTRFLQSLSQLAANPIHGVRVMSAKALVALVPLSEYSKVLAALIGDLPTICSNTTSHNALHGQLLQAGALLEAGLDTGCFSPQELRDVQMCLEEKLWLVSPTQRCPLIRAAYLKVVSLVLKWSSEDFKSNLQLLLLAEIEAPPSRLMIGSGIFQRAVTHFLCTYAVRTGSPHQLEQIGKWLLCDDIEIRVAVLSWITEHSGCKEELAGPWILKLLLSNLQSVLLEEKSSLDLLKNWLEAIVFLQEKQGELKWKSIPEDLEERVRCIEILLCNMEVAKYGPILHCQALCAVSLLLAESCQVLSPALHMRWVSLLEHCSDPTSCEVLRLGAATSLVLAGVKVISWALTVSLEHASLIVRIINGGICLLQDQDTRVRTQAAKFATRMYLLSNTSEELTHLQGNRALISLLNFLVQNCCDYRETFEVLMLHVPTSDVAGILVQLESKEVACLHKKDVPNVFAEPTAFARLLLPFLLQIVERLASSAAPHNWLKAWATDNHADIVRNVDHLKHRAIQGLPAVNCFCLLTAADLYTAVMGLLVRSSVLFHLLQTLESHNVDTSDFSGPSHQLKSDLEQLHGWINEVGLIPGSLAAEVARTWNSVTER